MLISELFAKNLISVKEVRKLIKYGYISDMEKTLQGEKLPHKHRPYFYKIYSNIRLRQESTDLNEIRKNLKLDKRALRRITSKEQLANALLSWYVSAKLLDAHRYFKRTGEVLSNEIDYMYSDRYNAHHKLTTSDRFKEIKIHNMRSLWRKTDGTAFDY